MLPATFSMTQSLSRRTVLRGLGTVLALPWLEAMGTMTSWAAGAAPRRTAPNRMAFVYVPNGKDMANWTPKTEGPGYELPDTMQALAPFKSDFNVITGLAADGARPHGD